MFDRKAYMKEYHQRPEVKAARKAYLKKHHKKYRQTLSCKLRFRLRLRRPDMKAKTKIRIKNHNLLKRASGTGVTNTQWTEILRKFNHRCAYCGASGNMTMDHVKPLSKGGKHSVGNVVPACVICNCKKGVNTRGWKPKIFTSI